MTQSKGLKLEEELKNYKSESVQLLYTEFGAEITAQIIRLFGGESLYIPLESTILRENKSDCIIKEYQSGSSCRIIAANHGVSKRTVRRIVERMKNNERIRSK